MREACGAGASRSPSGTRKDFDVIVVGVGAMGSAACLWMARKGLRVLGIERFSLDHGKGSSHGETRMTRLLLFEPGPYVALCKRSLEATKDLEKETGRKLYVQTGVLVAGPSAKSVAGKKKKGEAVFSLPDRAIEAAERCGVPCELLTAEEAKSRWPAFQGLGVHSSVSVAYSPDGGMLLSEQCIIACVEAAASHGCEFRFMEEVVALEHEGPDSWIVRTRGGSVFRSAKVCVTAGMWAREVVPALRDLAVPERQVLGWFLPVSGNGRSLVKEPRYAPERLPAFVVQFGDSNMTSAYSQRTVYGFPPLPGGLPGVKVGVYNHFFQKLSKGDDLGEGADAADERLLRDGLDLTLPEAAAGPCLSMSTCAFTNSPDNGFIVDTDGKGMIVAAGFSGHGFKYNMVIGELLSEMATMECDSEIGGETPQPEGSGGKWSSAPPTGSVRSLCGKAFSLERFGVSLREQGPAGGGGRLAKYADKVAAAEKALALQAEREREEAKGSMHRHSKL